VTLGLGQAKLFVFQARRDGQRPDQRVLGLFGNPPGIDHISFLVDDPDDLHARLRSWGVEVGPGPSDQDWGARAFGLQDPDGVNLYFLRWL
jgi:catechol 2,3-dioxygenase-like lactoylglutathione lyase family enzyme